MKVVLASASAVRLRTLQQAGIRPEVTVSNVDEGAFVADSPDELAAVLATAKARAVFERLGATEALVVGCDSVLELDGEALGKPGDAATAAARWRQMRARSGVLVTGHCVINASDGRQMTETARTTVHFADVSDDEIAAYVATGEPLHVAGAFTIEGYGGAFVTAIEGDHSNVLGISLPLLRSMLAEFGIAWTDLWIV